METAMNMLVPYVWRANYGNDTVRFERALETAHENARQYLSRAAARSLQVKINNENPKPHVGS